MLLLFLLAPDNLVYTMSSNGGAGPAVLAKAGTAENFLDEFLILGLLGTG